MIVFIIRLQEFSYQRKQHVRWNIYIHSYVYMYVHVSS